EPGADVPVAELADRVGRLDVVLPVRLPGGAGEAAGRWLRAPVRRLPGRPASPTLASIRGLALEPLAALFLLGPLLLGRAVAFLVGVLAVGQGGAQGHEGADQQQSQAHGNLRRWACPLPRAGAARRGTLRD